MTKSLVTKQRLEELLLAQVKAKPGCDKAHWLQISPRPGDPNWYLSHHDAECGEAMLSEAEVEIAARYNLPETDLDACACELHELAKLPGPEGQRKVDLRIDEYRPDAAGRWKLLRRFLDVSAHSPDDELPQLDYIKQKLS